MNIKTCKLIIILICFLFSYCTEKDENNLYTIKIENVNEYGKISVTPLKDVYERGEKVTISAIPNKDYNFVLWEGTINEDQKTQNKISISIEQNINLISVFEKIDKPDITEYSLKIDYDNTKGFVKISPKKLLYSPGEKVKLTAIPATGYLFEKWMGNLSETAESIDIIMNDNSNIKCFFKTENSETKEIVLKMQGKYNIISDKWEFTAEFFNKKTENSAKRYDIKIDNKQFDYDEFFNKYELNLNRADNNSEFIINIKHPDFGEKTYTISPTNFEKTNNISVDKSEDNTSFTLNWTDLKPTGYRIFKKLSSTNVSAIIVYENLIQDINYIFFYNNIWKSNTTSSEKYNNVRFWVTPVNRIVDFKETFAKDSYIEILGRHSSIIESKR